MSLKRAPRYPLYPPSLLREFRVTQGAIVSRRNKGVAGRNVPPIPLVMTRGRQPQGPSLRFPSRAVQPQLAVLGTFSLENHRRETSRQARNLSAAQQHLVVVSDSTAICSGRRCSAARRIQRQVGFSGNQSDTAGPGVSLKRAPRYPLYPPSLLREFRVTQGAIVSRRNKGVAGRNVPPIPLFCTTYTSFLYHLYL